MTSTPAPIRRRTMRKVACPAVAGGGRRVKRLVEDQARNLP